MKSRVKCVTCGNFLTDWLEPVPEDFVPKWDDHVNIVPPGMYWIATDDLNTLAGVVVINLNDRSGLQNHPDPKRFEGCCGPSGGGVNQLCQCGAEVATEVSDCWTSYYLHFEPGHTTLELQTRSLSPMG